MNEEAGIAESMSSTSDAGVKGGGREREKTGRHSPQTRHDRTQRFF